MENIKKGLRFLAADELIDANKKFPMFQSVHEGYAVILEEIEEVETELEEFKNAIDMLWQCIKINDENAQAIAMMKMQCIVERMAAESVQVMAMCQKFINSEVWK